MRRSTACPTFWCALVAMLAVPALGAIVAGPVHDLERRGVMSAVEEQINSFLEEWQEQFGEHLLEKDAGPATVDSALRKAELGEAAVGQEDRATVHNTAVVERAVPVPHDEICHYLAQSHGVMEQDDAALQDVSRPVTRAAAGVALGPERCLQRYGPAIDSVALDPADISPAYLVDRRRFDPVRAAAAIDHLAPRYIAAWDACTAQGSAVQLGHMRDVLQKSLPRAALEEGARGQLLLPTLTPRKMPEYTDLEESVAVRVIALERARRVAGQVAHYEANLTRELLLANLLLRAIDAAERSR